MNLEEHHMLKLENVTLTYPDGDAVLRAVDHVSLQVDTGEMAAISGPSGSGKSSLLAIAATLIRPDEGRVWIGKEEVSNLRQKARTDVRRNHLGIVFQAPNLIPSLTVREQLEVMARIGSTELASLNKIELQARINAMLQEVGLADRARFLPEKLSGGQRQRVNIARGLIHDPEVLVVDEPTSALDSDRSREIFDLLAQLTHERDLATVVVTHDVEYVDRFDAHYEMVDGALAPFERSRLVA